MLKLNLTSQFKHDLKLCKKRNYNISLLNAIVNTLRIPAALPQKNKDHALKGNYIVISKKGESHRSDYPPNKFLAVTFYKVSRQLIESNWRLFPFI